MKTAKARDNMVAMVKDFFGKFRTFASLPEIKNPVPGSVLIPLADARHEWSYVESLHTACATGKFPIGRCNNSFVLPVDPDNQ